MDEQALTVTRATTSHKTNEIVRANERRDQLMGSQYRKGANNGSRDPCDHRFDRARQACNFGQKLLDSAPEEKPSMSSVLKKRRKKMRKHKYKKLRQRQKFLRRKT